jgi:hypothetical protein
MADWTKAGAERKRVRHRSRDEALAGAHRALHI